MRLAVDTGSYASARGLLYDANRGVTEQMAELATTLDACGAMSGTDSGGRQWAEAYDRVSSTLVRAGADLGGSLGAMADLLDASLVNHEGADVGARLYPGSPETPGARQATEQLTPAPVPSAFGGTGGQPEGWQWLAEHLEGLLWPDAATATMRSAGQAWVGAAESLETWSWAATSASYALETQRSPEAPIATSAARELGTHATDLAAVCRDVGTACTTYAGQVDEHHAEIESICRELLTWTAVDQATGAVLSFFTGGGAEVAAQLVESGVMARYAARVVGVLRRLIELAEDAAALISRGLGRVTEILARLRVYLALRGTRALERVGVTIVGRRALSELPVEVQQQVDEAIERSVSGKLRFPGNDGKTFQNRNPTYRLPAGSYRSWRAVGSGAKDDFRVLIRGDVHDPDAIYIWDHTSPPVKIGP